MTFPEICGIAVACMVLGLAGCTASKVEKSSGEAQNPSPMTESTRRHVRLPDEVQPGTTISIPGVLEEPVEVFIPEAFSEAEGVDILIHFNGPSYIANAAVSTLKRPAIAVNVHLGAGSAVYERPFIPTGAFPELVSAIVTSLAEHDVALEDSFRVFLSGFSAGYGAIRAILRTHANRVDGVLLLDGLHTDYIPAAMPLFDGGVLNTDKLDVFVDFARRAVAGEKRFVITHSEIFPGTFASTTETTDYILASLSLDRTPVLEWGPVGMQLLSRVDEGSLKVLGFAGNSVRDHVDHFHGMPEFLELLTKR